MVGVDGVGWGDEGLFGGGEVVDERGSGDRVRRDLKGQLIFVDSLGGSPKMARSFNNVLSSSWRSNKNDVEIGEGDSISCGDPDSSLQCTRNCADCRPSSMNFT